MRGFAITPMLFVGIFLIVGLMMITFIDTDTRITSGISQEAKLTELQEAFLEHKITTSSLLYFYSVDNATKVNTSEELENSLENLLGGAASVTCLPGSFGVQLNYTFYKKSQDAEINRSYSLYREIACSEVEELTGNNATIECC